MKLIPSIVEYNCLQFLWVIDARDRHLHFSWFGWNGTQPWKIGIRVQPSTHTSSIRFHIKHHRSIEWWQPTTAEQEIPVRVVPLYCKSVWNRENLSKKSALFQIICTFRLTDVLSLSARCFFGCCLSSLREGGEFGVDSLEEESVMLFGSIVAAGLMPEFSLSRSGGDGVFGKVGMFHNSWACSKRKYFTNLMKYVNFPIFKYIKKDLNYAYHQITELPSGDCTFGRESVRLCGCGWFGMNNCMWKKAERFGKDVQRFRHSFIRASWWFGSRASAENM